ncbi:MAG: origin of replication binding protein-domain-containing protein [Linnemannia gamsii]|nr:MAG: origin of replication binding protein-domain-containing protein [Linnemannia gamsii]
MTHKFESTYFFKTDEDQPKGPQARCHEWSDKNSHKFFVAIDGPRRFEYSSYKDPARFLEAYADVPDAERCFFEQIREGQACNEYYDIDWTLGQVADESDILRLEQQVFTAFLNVRNQHAPDYPLDIAHCRVLSASNNKKISLHIVIPTYVFENNNMHMKAFVLAFQDTWKRSAPNEDSALLEGHIDMGVYNRNRIMWILGSCKLKEPSRPLLRAVWHEPSMVAEDEEFLITNIGPDCIQVTCSTQEVVRAPSTSRSPRTCRDQVQSTMPQQLVDTVKAKFMQTPQATQFEMHCKQDCAMIFRLERKAEGHCIICKREHGRENAYLSLAKSGAIFFHCHRSCSPAGVEVCKRNLALAVEIEVLEVRGPQPPSLLIRCDTGGGKTVYTEELVKANKKSRFVAITCRRSLADMLEERLGFENYHDISDIIVCDWVVVQAESLYKINLKFYCEDTILILDEVSSLIKQMCSDKTHGNKHNLNLQVFERLIQRATRVICLDADLSDEEVEIMKSLRSDFIVWNNTFQQQKDDNVVLFDSKMKLIQEALDLLRLHKRLWISSTMSARCTEALHAMLTKAGYKGKCVTKNVDEAFKRDASKDINNVMAGLDYFIHTPTISVGIDYNTKGHVDCVIGIFSTCSEVDVESCMQMMRRVRHVNDKTYLVHVDAAIKDLPATAPEVKDWICNQLDIVTGKVRWSSTLKLQFDDANNLTIPDDLYHRMYCHVMAKKHLSMNNFRSRLIRRMTQAGCIVTGRGDKLPRGHPIPKELKEKEKEIAAAWHQQIASAGAISPDEFERLSRGTRELDSDQRASVHRFALMRACGPSLKSCLEVVQQREDLGQDYSLRGPTTADAHSRLERSQFVKLGYVVDILLACGFEDPFATNEVPAEDIKSRVDGIWTELESKMTQICTSLKIRRPRSTSCTFKSKLAFINTVLLEVLGAKIGTPEFNKRRTKLRPHYEQTRSLVAVAQSEQQADFAVSRSNGRLFLQPCPTQSSTGPHGAKPSADHARINRAQTAFEV